MKLLITLLLSTLALFIYVKRSYKYASIQDSIDVESYASDMSAPIDYEETQAYKDNEVWFTGMGRCWMRELMKILMIVVITLNTSTIVFQIQHGLYPLLWDKILIIILCLQIISQLSDIKKLEKEKVTILRINNRSDNEWNENQYS